MISCVGDENLILAVTSHVPRVHKLAVSRALLSKLQQKLSLLSEDLHPVVVLVRDDQPAQTVQTDACWSVELPRSGALCSELAVECSVPWKGRVPL